MFLYDIAISKKDNEEEECRDKRKRILVTKKRCDIDMEAMARITGEIYQCRTKIVRKIGYGFFMKCNFFVKEEISIPS